MFSQGHSGVDPKLASRRRSPIRLNETLVEVNDMRKVAMAARVVTACGGRSRGSGSPCSGYL